MQCRIPKRNIGKGICSNDQNQDLGCTRYVVVHEAPTVRLAQLDIYFAVQQPKEEALEDVEADQEVQDEDDGDYERAKWGELRNARIDQMCDMGLCHYGGIWLLRC